MKHTEYARYLRETADLMGQAAKDAPGGPWGFNPAGDYECGDAPCCYEYWDDQVRDNRGTVIIESGQDTPAAQHAARWHPLVTAGVADLLISISNDIEAQGEIYALTNTTVARAIKVAQQWRREGLYE